MQSENKISSVRDLSHITEQDLFVSIIIPVKEINSFIRQAIPHLLGLDHNRFEVLLLPDKGSLDELTHLVDPQGPGVTVLPTGSKGPAEKRNIGSKKARGDLLAFIDDDAYPEIDWLKKAAVHFSKPGVAAVGGPALTPKENTFWQKVSGAVFLSRLGAGNPERYWPVGKIRSVDDWPSVNLIVRRKDFIRVGSFDTKYWPGEDTLLCKTLTHDLGKKIIYDPSLIVWHHRRSSIITHLKQVGRYGLHRGYFAKRFPENSRKLTYFMPSIFLLALLIGGILTFTKNLILVKSYIVIIVVYLTGLFFAFLEIIRRETTLSVAVSSIPYILLTHLFYGYSFLKGFVWTDEMSIKLNE